VFWGLEEFKDAKASWLVVKQLTVLILAIPIAKPAKVFKTLRPEKVPNISVYF
jgi:hypothetical protein